MSLETLLIIAAITFSAFLKGSLGLGFSTICLALLANFIDLRTAISIVLLPSLASNFMVMASVGNFKLSVQQFYPMFLMAIVGMGIGLFFLERNVFGTTLLAIVLICYGAWALFNRDFKIDENLIFRLNPVIGLSTGIVNGITGSQIFPIMPYLVSLPISRDTLLLTINLSFTLCSVIMLSFFLYQEILTPSALLRNSLGLIPVYIGIQLGTKIRRHLSDARFHQGVMILLITLGLMLLI